MQESTQKVQTEKRSAFSRMAETYFEAIAGTLDHRGTVAQRMLCMVMMGVLTGARLPGGLYACQTAMFAVLLRQGFCVPAAFAGAAAGVLCFLALTALMRYMLKKQAKREAELETELETESENE